MDHTFHHLGKTIAVPPYSHLAELYDTIMNHVDYSGWGNYIHRMIKHFSPESKYLCDISCGTGSLALNLAYKGYHVSGLDYSESMIKIAREKAAETPYPITFKTGDMRNVSLPRPVHIIISLYDSFNYLYEESGFAEMFQSVYQSLLPGGLFIFDICTEYNALKYFAEHHDSGIVGRTHFKRHSYYERDTCIQNTEFAIKYPGDSTWYIEHHRQKILPSAKVRQLIPSTRFQCLGEFDNLTLKKASPQSERIHFVLKKKILTA